MGMGSMIGNRSLLDALRETIMLDFGLFADVRGVIRPMVAPKIPLVAFADLVRPYQATLGLNIDYDERDPQGLACAVEVCRELEGMPGNGVIFSSDRKVIQTVKDTFGGLVPTGLVLAGDTATELKSDPLLGWKELGFKHVLLKFDPKCLKAIGSLVDHAAGYDVRIWVNTGSSEEYLALAKPLAIAGATILTEIPCKINW